jgi:hypothetical protein
MSNFREFDRATGFLLPPSLDEWLPERHLARFVVEVIDGLTCRRWQRAIVAAGRPAIIQRYIECSTQSFDFGAAEGRCVEAAFDDGSVTSDAGALFLRSP